jgi:transposase
MERIAMSQQERDRLEWLKRTQDKMISQREAAERMGVSERWVRKLLKRMKREGDRVVVHGLRGRASNRKIAAKVQAQAMEILKRPDWHDFGPTFASEQLAQRHQIQLSDETLRKWMITAGLWNSKSRKLEEVHCWRPRRSGFGYLVQWDTSRFFGKEKVLRSALTLVVSCSDFWSIVPRCPQMSSDVRTRRKIRAQAGGGDCGAFSMPGVGYTSH